MPRWLLGALTAALALGVLVMHAMGTGHHGAVVSTSAVDSRGTGHHVVVALAPAAEHAADAGGLHAAPRPPAADASPRNHALTPRMADRPVPDAGHDATAVCLAVLPLLLLVRRAHLHRLWRVAARGIEGGSLGLPGVLAGWSRPPPSVLAPSLAKLCVLRV